MRTYKELKTNKEYTVFEVSGDLLDLIDSNNRHKYVTTSELAFGFEKVLTANDPFEFTLSK